MCLAVPGQIIAITGSRGVVRFGTVRKDVSLTLLPHPHINDWVMVHAGFAISTVEEDDALATLAMFGNSDAGHELGASAPSTEEAFQ